MVMEAPPLCGGEEALEEQDGEDDQGGAADGDVGHDVGGDEPQHDKVEHDEPHEHQRRGRGLWMW